MKAVGQEELMWKIVEKQGTQYQLKFQTTFSEKSLSFIFIA